MRYAGVLQLKGGTVRSRPRWLECVLPPSSSSIRVFQFCMSTRLLSVRLSVSIAELCNRRDSSTLNGTRARVGLT